MKMKVLARRVKRSMALPSWLGYELDRSPKGRVKWDRSALGRIAERQSGRESGGGIRKPLKPGEMASLDRHIGGDGGDGDTDTLSDYHGLLLLSSNSSFRAEGDKISP